MSRRSKVIIAVCTIALVLGGGALAFSRTLTGAALLKSRDHFIQSDANPAVYYEPGMEEEARLVAAGLPRAMSHLEAQGFLPLAKPYRVYVCSTQESFNEYMGAPPGATARGVKVFNDIFLAPVSLCSWRGDTHDVVLGHELAHLYVYQRLGHRRALWDLPVWFNEGLAVMASGGGGEGVTAADAVEAILAGYRFVPDDRGSLLKPKRPADYGMGGFMFYRQSELFVTYIREQDPEAFGDFMLALQQGDWGSFEELFEASFDSSIAGLWGEFENHLRSSRTYGDSA